ncbi:MAG: hypothetical protein K9L62_02050 [Vallitaleaceae bacterium]|nr:hypothetical protein [Vallitaleaceae bacterium]
MKKSKWILLEQPINGWWIHQHIRTNRIKSFKTIKDNREIYVWCRICGWELTRNSHKETVVFNKTDRSALSGKRYICTRCGTMQIFNFTISPYPLPINESGDIRL